MIREIDPAVYKSYSMVMDKLLMDDLETSIGKTIFQISGIPFSVVWDTLFWRFSIEMNATVFRPDHSLDQRIMTDKKLSRYRIIRIVRRRYLLDLFWKLFFSTRQNKTRTRYNLLAVVDSYNTFKSIDPILKACSSDCKVDVIVPEGSFRPLAGYMKNSQYRIIRYFDFGQISDYLRVYRVAIFLLSNISALKKIFQKHWKGYRYEAIDYSTWLLAELIVQVVHDHIFTRRIVAERKPRCVIVSNDHEIFPRSIITNANQLGIPTFHYPHAVINTTWAYSNIRARKIFVGGDAEKKYLLSMGYKDSDVIISGRIMNYSSNVTAYNMIAIFTAIRTVTHYYQFADLCQLADNLVKQIVDAFPDYDIKLQPHPADNIERYPGIKAMIDSQKIGKSMTYGDQETLKASFINIVPYNSNICLDSICHGKLTVAYNPFDSAPTIPWEQYGSCLFSKTIQEVISNIRKIIELPKLREKLKKNCIKMRKDYFYNISEEEHTTLVVECIKNEVLRKSTKPSSQ